jgi:hypothetical protein
LDTVCQLVSGLRSHMQARISSFGVVYCWRGVARSSIFNSWRLVVSLGIRTSRWCLCLRNFRQVSYLHFSGWH